MQKQARIATALFTLLAVAGGGSNVAIAQTAAFTQDQVDSGRQNFMDNCAECHNKDLSGDAGPTLAGKAFTSRKWEKQPTANLFNFIQSAMPPCTAGTLSDSAYTDILAFLLWANGGKAGTQALEAKSTIPIGSIVTGTARAELKTAAK